MHTAAEIGIDDFQAKRSPDERYRTTPLQGPVDAHEGRLLPRRPLRRRSRDVVDHYDGYFGLGLTAQEKADLVEYLRSN